MSKLLLLDTNLLLFYLVAQVDLAVLRSFKRVSGFRDSDLPLLNDLVGAYSGMVTTPHVLTEVSNFVDQAPLRWRMPLIYALQQFALEQAEVYETSSALVQRQEFAPLGLSDTGLLSLSKEATVATLDYHLYQRILAAGREVVHFEKLRTERAEF